MKGLCTFIFALTLTIAAQDGPKTIDAGILNGRARAQPRPEYPEDARLAHVGGLVGVNVVVDENGIVVSAEAETDDQRIRYAADGTRLAPVALHPSLRAAAEIAARQATFSPVKLRGEPVRIRGKITYNFIADHTDRPARVGDIYGPQLNSRAVSLPQPTYPAAAKAANVQGTVTVEVTVDGRGAVTAATATSGHPLLRAAAEEAARHATFRPMRIGDTPIQFKGVVAYNFAIREKAIQ